MAAKKTLKKTFSEMILKAVAENDSDKSYISHIVDYCDREGIPYQKMSHYVNRELKEKLRLEGISKFMVKDDEDEDLDDDEN